jgi:hypothetical protein
MSRTALRDDYDAEILLMPLRGETTHVHALFKLTYAIEPDTCRRVPAEPLLHDWRSPDLDRTKIGGSDFWLAKPFTDLVVQGAACVPGGKQAERMVASVALGKTRKDLAIIGRRAITWVDGRPRIGHPEPFTTMPVTWENAYGGIDWRVEVPGADALSSTGIPELALRTRFEHPGIYPRNPFGSGYLVKAGAVPGLVAPTIEDPAEPITAERLVCGDPAVWWRQPLPWCMDWTNPVMFPRACWFSPESDPWYPAPDDLSLPEVSRGMVSASFLHTRCPEGGVDARFFQGASTGLVISRPAGGQILTITGMHPDMETLEVVLPATKAEITFDIEGRHLAQPARLHHLVCRPNDLRLTMVFAAEAPLHRPFLPGIHRHIPVAASFNGDPAVPYCAPAPVSERVAAAQSRQAAP